MCRSFLPPTVRYWHRWLARSLTFWIDLLRSTAQMHSHCWVCLLAFFPFNLFHMLSLNTSLRILRAAATFQHGVLTQLACTESTVTLLRSLQYGSKFGLRPLFACQDHTCGRVLVQLYSGNVVFLGPPCLEECNSVLSLCDHFRCHYQWPTCRLTVLSMSLAQLYLLKPHLSSDPTFPSSNK